MSIINKPHGEVVMIGKCYEGVISQTGVISNAPPLYQDIKQDTMKKYILVLILTMVNLTMYSQNHTYGLADEYNKLAENHKKNSRPDSAIIYYEKASLEFQASNNMEGFVNTYNQICIILTRQDQYEKAKEYLNKALSTGLSTLDSNNLITATTYISLGVVYNEEKNYNQSLTYHNKALSIRLLKLGEYHVDVATSYGNIGNVYLNSKNYDKSIEAHSKAMQIREKLFGKASAEIVESFYGLGNAYKEKKEYSISLEYYEKSLKNKIAQRGEGHKDLVKFYKKMSDVYYLMGNNKQGDFYKIKAEEIK